MIRVAVIQIENLGPGLSHPAHALMACARLIDRAIAEHGPAVLLFPELELSDEDELSQALESTLQERSVRHQVWLIGSVQHRGETYAVWTSPEGLLMTRPASDLERTGTGTFAPETAIIATPHGKIGLSVGREGLHLKVSRALSLAGADWIGVSLGLRTNAELSLRIPARAAENQLFYVVAARVADGSEVYPSDLHTLPPGTTAGPTETTAVSQIVAPSGLAVARGELAVCELPSDPLDAPEWLAKVSRRPELYRGFPLRSRTPTYPLTIEEVDVAALAFSDLGSAAHAIAWAREHVEELAAKEVGLIVLPELFCFDPNLTDLHQAAAADFLTVVQTLARACRRTATHVATSLVERVGDAFFHVGVLIGQAGIVLRQRQLHLTHRLAWAEAGSRLEIAHLPWGRLALAVGEDALVPEVLDGLGRAEVEIVAAPLSARVAPLASLTLSAATDEAGYAVVAAARPEHSSDGQLVSASFVADPARWPLQRALAEQEALRATVRLSSIREMRRAGRNSLLPRADGAGVREPTRVQAPALD